MATHGDTLKRVENTKTNTLQATHEEIFKIIGHGTKIMEQKAPILLNMKDELRRTSEHYNKVNEMQSIG
jgi:hypothetical protein